MTDMNSQAYHAVLGALYQLPIELGDFSEDALTDILETALSITEVAEYLECVSDTAGMRHSNAY